MHHLDGDANTFAGVPDVEAIRRGPCLLPGAHQGYPIGAPSEPHPPDPVRRYLQDAFWIEGGQLTLDRLRPRQRHRGEKPQRSCGKDGLHERLGDERLGAFHRRRHHTTKPAAIAENGNNTTTNPKTRRVCGAVRRIRGGTAVRDATVVPRSSRASQRTAEIRKALLAM